MINVQEVEKLAKLARINLTNEEKESLAKEIDLILDYVGQVQEVSASFEHNQGGLNNIVREDENPHESGIFTRELIERAPDKKGDLIRVKNIL
jgi:aspartyl-tRNA(Asn)/glutamyl-tRNA(Gln) amidotransferase subunit C